MGVLRCHRRGIERKREGSANARRRCYEQKLANDHLVRLNANQTLAARNVQLAALLDVYRAAFCLSPEKARMPDWHRVASSARALHNLSASDIFARVRCCGQRPAGTRPGGAHLPRKALHSQNLGGMPRGPALAEGAPLCCHASRL